LTESDVICLNSDIPRWPHVVHRVCGQTGSLITCSDAQHTNLQLLVQPVLCEISRWDALKGWIQLMHAFVHLKQNMHQIVAERAGGQLTAEEHLQYLQSMVLVLAGPDPKAIQDDPEGTKVFRDLCSFYKNLGTHSPDIQRQIFILSLPMEDTERNALIVNALQRLSSMVIQNSLREGFGLTVTEAMYKGTPMIASNVGGIRVQVEDGINGIHIKDPDDYKSVAKSVNKMIVCGLQQRKKFAVAGKQTVMEKYLIWSQCRSYLKMLQTLM